MCRLLPGIPSPADAIPNRRAISLIEPAACGGSGTECGMEKRQIPNILSAIRLLAVPVFVAVFFSDIANANIWALVIFVAAELTDILDGYLARRNGWITDVGKILDPLADKLMQAAAIISG